MDHGQTPPNDSKKWGLLSGLGSENPPLQTRTQWRKKRGGELEHAEVLLTNACSVNNKWGELAAITENTDIVAVTETWLTRGYSCAALRPPQFVEFRTDRPDGRMGGGSLLLVANKYETIEVGTLATPNVQATACILMIGGRKIAVVCVYRSPSASPEEGMELIEYLKALTNEERVLFLGDFNAPEIDWTAWEAPNGTCGEHLIWLLEDKGLVQHVTENTRFREGQNPSTLDLIISKTTPEVEGVSYGPPLGSSDHATLSFKLRLQLPQPPHKTRRSLRQINPQRLIADALEMEWSSEGGIEDKWGTIKSNFTTLMDRHAPLKRVRRRGCPPWWRSRAEKAQRRKAAAWRRYRESRGHTRYLQYKRARAQANKVQQHCRERYERRLAKGAKTNPKAYYNYVQSKASLRIEVGAVKNEQGRIAENPQEKAEVLLKAFQGFHQGDDGHDPRHIARPEIANEMEPIRTTVGEVRKRIQQLQLGKAPGPDGIHPEFIKHLAEIVAQPMVALFNQSLVEGCLPAEWKVAKVAPIHKGGDRGSTTNYRPVSLTAISLKILERVIRDKLVEHLTSNGLLSAAQHGFRKRKSCTTNLLCFLDEITESLDRGEQVEVCYLDFRKAFDLVNHRLLLLKLETYGVEPGLLRWIRAFLCGRRFYVEVGGERSTEAGVHSGVPQGSVLGPILFLIYINDLGNSLTSSYYMFADDVKVVGKVHGGDIQGDLDKVYQWSKEWALPLNVDKCMRLVAEEGTEHRRWLGEGVNRTELERKTEVRDLGVIMREDFKPEGQCVAAANKARSALHQLRRAVTSRDPEVLLPLYKVYVRPHLEYAVQAWRPSLRREVKLLERVQRQFTRMFQRLRELPYEERLRRLQLFSLERRRQRGDLIEAFRQVKGLSQIEGGGLLQRSTNPNLRGHSLKLSKPRARTRLRAQFFSHRVINGWNKLPEEVVTSTTVGAFKRKLDEVWEHIFPDLV